MKTVMLNACHTSGGGGLVYLQNVLPHLAAASDIRWVLVLNPAVKDKLDVPENMEIVWAPEGLGFWRGHAWEQGYLPVLQKKIGAEMMLCNANYGPLLAKNLIPIIHTTPRAAGSAKGLKMWLYWRVLWLLTVASVWKAGRVGSVARHVLKDYGGAWLARKTVIAPPGSPAVGAGTRKDPHLVVAVGDVYAQKHYPLLVEAFAKLLKKVPQARLEIIGRKVDGAEVVAVETAMLRWGVSSHVEMVGGVLHEVLLRRLGEAAVLASASGAECFNMPLLEAMAVGTPVVCGDMDFQREVVGDEGAAVLAQGGENAAENLAEALYAVMSDKGYAGQLCEAGFARARTFTWRGTAEALLGLVR
jgi:glycosyltransferase involved in cell wall biosynthesis